MAEKEENGFDRPVHIRMTSKDFERVLRATAKVGLETGKPIDRSKFLRAAVLPFAQAVLDGKISSQEVWSSVEGGEA